MWCKLRSQSEAAAFAAKGAASAAALFFFVNYGDSSDTLRSACPCIRLPIHSRGNDRVYVSFRRAGFPQVGDAGL
jgi:hypothetical protein